MTHAELLAAGFEIDADAYARLAQFVRLLLKENERLNLTAIRDEAGVWVEHICDSLSLLPLIRQVPPASLLDLGTGAGVPGVPVACVCPELEVTLLDATRKKLAAVERIVSTLHLTNVRLTWGRAETLAHDPQFRERFDAVTARAVAELPVLLEYATGFVRPGGVAWFFKTLPGCAKALPGWTAPPAAATEGSVGPPWPTLDAGKDRRLGFEDSGEAGELWGPSAESSKPSLLTTEIAAASAAAAACALEYVGVHGYELPGVAGRRAIVIYRKQAALRPDLPRPPGRPGKRPL